MSRLQPVRELVLPDPASGFRWFEHDYPHPLARWHHHPEIEIHAIRGSSGTALIGASATVFQSGDVYVVGSDVPHHWVSAVEEADRVVGRDLLVQLHPDTVRSLVEALPDLTSVGTMFRRERILEPNGGSLRIRGDAAAEAVRMLEQIGQRTGIDRIARLMDLLSILVSAPEHERTHLDVVRNEVGGPSSALFSEAIRYLQENLAEPLTIHDVAEHLGLSISGVSRLFTRATADGFGVTLNHLRVGEAARRLAESDHRIADIALQAGFANLSTFNRVFRQHVGVTPSEYRVMRRHEPGAA